MPEYYHHRRGLTCEDSLETALRKLPILQETVEINTSAQTPMTSDIGDIIGGILGLGFTATGGARAGVPVYR